MPPIAPGTAARETAEAANALRAAARDATAVLTEPGLIASVARSPRSGARALTALLRAVTGRDGLGFAPDGGRVARAATALASRRGLAADIAVTSLKLRITQCAALHPELHKHAAVRELLDAVADDDRLRAAAAFRQPAQGTGEALAVLAPVFAEVTAWNRLADENPFNDEHAWAVVTGRPKAAGARRPRPRTAARCHRQEADPVLAAALDQGSGVSALLRGLDALGTDGRIAVRRVRAADGVERYVVLLPGTGTPATAPGVSPQDLVHAVTARGGTYTRAARRALGAVLPEDAEVALIGHSTGGIVAMNLAGMPAANDAWQLTHVVAVGSPIDSKRAYDPRTQVITLVNEHDVVPHLEGRSRVPVFPAPSAWVEITWADPSPGFPVGHAVAAYADNLDRLIPEERDRIDAMLADYAGPVAETAVFRLSDR